MQKRLSIKTSLVPDEAVYHAQCYAQFFFNAHSTNGNRHRPEGPKMQAVFDLTCHWLENENDLFTLEYF